MLALESSTASGEDWEDVKYTYRSLLKQLTYNSKERIDVLTILAKENMRFAKDIVSRIEAQINKARPSQKLPIMYLMDSIIKNVGGDYLPEFAKNLPLIFPCVFEQVDANTKKRLFQLRSTWNGLFPVKKLFVLDIRVNTLDPAWPIKPLPANFDFSSILAKCKFPKKSEHESTSESDRKVITTENSETQRLNPSAKQSPCLQRRSSRKRRCGSLSPTSSPPKIKKVSCVSAQPGPQDQAQQHFHHPESLAHNPEGAVDNPRCCS